MAVMDEFKTERQALKDRPFKVRFGHFWYYNKWYVIGGIIAVIFLTSLIKDMVTNKDYALYGIVVNALQISETPSDLTDGYIEYSSIDTSKYAVLLDASLRLSQDVDQSSMSTTQLIMAHSAAQDLDVLAMDTFNFNKYAYNHTFVDLRECLSTELLAELEDSIYYIDRAVLDKIDEAKDNANMNFSIEYPDHTKPELMEDPIPVGINLDKSEVFNSYYTFAQEEGFIGILNSSKRQENSIALIEYLYK